VSEGSQSIFLADHHPQVRSALRLLLCQEPGLTIAGEAGSTAELLAGCAHTRPALILLDWDLPGLRGQDLIGLLRVQHPETRVVALSGRPESRLAALSSGADAFASKGEPPERLLAIVRATLQSAD
jgi:DNA-binding NarL/FixJ family response regulator